MTPFLLLIFGLVLILLEFYIPGAIMGIIGGILLIFSGVVFAYEEHSGIEFFLFFLLIIIGLAGVIKFAIWRIRHNRKKNTLYLDTDQQGYQASYFDETVIGKKGTVLSDLKPSGHIIIEGKQYQAVAQVGYVPKGSEVEVLFGQGAYLVVQQIKKG